MHGSGANWGSVWKDWHWSGVKKSGGIPHPLSFPSESLSGIYGVFIGVEELGFWLLDYPAWVVTIGRVIVGSDGEASVSWLRVGWEADVYSWIFTLDWPGWNYAGPMYPCCSPSFRVFIRLFCIVLVKTPYWFMRVLCIASFTISCSFPGSDVNVTCWGPGRGFFLIAPLLVRP